MSSRQRIRAVGGRVTYDEDRRDRSFSINLRLHLSRWRRVQLNPVGGIGIVQHSGWSQLIAVNDAPVVSTRLRRDLPTDVGVTMGFDVRIGGERLALMPSFRFWRRITDRYPPNRSETTGQYLGGASEWTLSHRTDIVSVTAPTASGRLHRQTSARIAPTVSGLHRQS